MSAFFVGGYTPGHGCFIDVCAVPEPGFGCFVFGSCFGVAMSANTTLFELVAVVAGFARASCAGVIAVVVVIERCAALGIEPSRMANPRFNKRIYFDDSICCHCRKRAFDGGVGIIAFRIVSGALPANAVNLEVRVTEAKTDVFMGGIG